MNLSKRVFVFSIFLVLVFIAAPLCALETGELAPDFKLKSIAGEEISLSDFKGRVVLLKLATTWCPTCKQLSGEIEKVGGFLQEKDVVVLEVFVQDSAAMIEKYLGDTKPPMTFHALLDDGQVYDAYNVYLIPRLLLVDADQIVRFESSGRIVLAADITALIEEFGRPLENAGQS